jgi:hypothetical protein
MEPKANPVATGALAAGIVPAALVALAPVALVALAALAPADLAALAAPAPADLVALAALAPVALAALVALAPVVTAVTVDRARRVDLAAAALLASLGIPRTDPDVMDPVVARVVRILILNR